MKSIYVLVFFIIVCLASACKHRSTSENSLNSSKAGGGVSAWNQIPNKYKAYFKLGDQRKFSFEFQDIERLKLVKIDSLQLIDLVQEDELLGYNTPDFEHYFYSFQAEKPNYQAVTVLLNIEYSYVIYYLIFSTDGKLLSKFEVAREGGDEVTTREYGHFVNDTTYLKTRVTTEMDSVKQQIAFNRKGKLIYY